MPTPIKPGDCYDKNRVPIYPGDLLKSYHFTDRRRKKWYLYHTAVWNGSQLSMEMVPTCHLEPTKINGGGRCWLSQELGDNTEIIQGYGPGDTIDYTERKKVPKPVKFTDPPTNHASITWMK